MRSMMAGTNPAINDSGLPIRTSPTRGIQELDVPDPLLQFIEDDVSAFEQGASRRSWARHPWGCGREVEPEAHPPGSRWIRKRRAGHAELPRGLGHAAAFCDGRKNMKVAQFEALAYSALPTRLPVDHRIYLLASRQLPRSASSTSSLGWLLPSPRRIRMAAWSAALYLLPQRTLAAMCGTAVLLGFSTWEARRPPRSRS